MDYHKSLYQELHSQTPHHKRENRRLQEANRIKQRRDRFQNSRNISVSPVRHKEIIIPLCTNDKENANTTRLAKLVCNTNPEKLKKQEAFLKRFAEYMDKKKNAKMQQEGVNKKKPFVSAVGNGSGRQAAGSSSIVPKGHHEGFRPPVGLKSHKPNEKTDPINKPVLKSRQSIYTVVPTPPRKPKETDDKLKNKFPIARKALPTNLHTRILNSNKTPNVAAANTVRTVNKLNTKTPVDKPKPVVKKNSTTKNTLETKPATAATMPTLRSTLKPRALKMPPPPAPNKKPVVKKPEPTTTATNRQTGAVAKARSMAIKKSPLKSGGARLAQNLKAKKPLNATKKINVPNVQVNGKQILNIFKNNNNKPLPEDMVIQTPKDFTLNPFEEFVTSTKLRNSSHNLEVEGTSPIEASPKRAHTVKKFNFIRYSEAPNDVSDNDQKENENEQVVENAAAAAEANNVSDEENKTLVETPAIDEKTPTKSKPEEEKPANYLSPFVSVTRGKVSLKKEKEKRNSMYLQIPAEADNDATTVATSPLKSPKYSVEVRRILEAVRYFRKQLQDEIDRLHQLCDIWELYKTENQEKLQNENVEDMINVTIGQTRLLTSKKFMQFKGLIDRCEAGATGIGAVEYDGSEDTKPITSVDLEGFWSMLGLQVDNLQKRFDSLNRWKLNDWVDPDEVKPKIKKNLTKVKKAKAAPATKAKPSSALQQMLRKMQAEKRKNIKQQNGCNEDVVLTPTKTRRSGNSNNSTPRKSMDTSQSRRLSIVVKDRKYYSPAATVISVSSPNRRNSILQRKTSQDSPKFLKHIEKFNETLDNMQTSLDLRKTVLINGNTRRMSINPQSPMRNSLDAAKETVKAVNGIFTVDPEEEPTSSHFNFNTSPPQQSPVPTGRKSILKTPGTAKSRLRNVIFNEKLRVKKFNFLINEDDQLNGENGHNEANESHEEDLAQRVEDEPQRTLTLRNRKVKLRPSCEIVIPLK